MTNGVVGPGTFNLHEGTLRITEEDESDEMARKREDYLMTSKRYAERMLTRNSIPSENFCQNRK